MKSIATSTIASEPVTTSGTRHSRAHSFLAGLTAATTTTTLGIALLCQAGMLVLCQSAAAQETAGPAARHPFTLPPQKEACYGHATDGWHETPCASPESVLAHYPHPELQFSIDYTANNSPLHVPTYGAIMNYGYLGIDFNSIGSLKDNIYGQNARSLQLNTNFFPGNNGHQAWVQFVVQTQPGYQDAVCIWNVDVNVTVATNNAAGYNPTCVNALRSRDYIIASDDPFVIGYTLPASSTSGPVLGMLAFLPWMAPGFNFDMAAVVVKDTYGLNANWNTVSGSVLGLGKGAEAVFTNTNVTTTLSSASCGSGQFAAACPVPRYLYLPPTITASTSGVTAESNNLFPGNGGQEPTVNCTGEHCTMIYTSNACTGEGCATIYTYTSTAH